MPPPPHQQHPRDIIRNALEARQNQPEIPIKGYHICFMMLSIIVAGIIIVYEVQVLMSQEDNKSPFSKWVNTNSKASSVRYLTNIKDIKGNYYYDYIIIGAGTAGSVLATKLSHSQKTYSRILVIEKSKSKHSLMQKNNKITAFHHVYKSDQWEIESVNNHNTWIKSSLKKHQNNIWSIGHPSDYDKLWNITDWNYDDILPYFQSSEKVIINEVVDEFGVEITDENELNLRKQKRNKAKSNAVIAWFMSILPLGAGGDSLKSKRFDYGDKDVTKNRGDNGNLLIKQARKYSMVNAFIVNAINANYEYNVDHNSFFNYNTDEDNEMVNTVSYQQYNKYGIFESYIDKLKKSKFAAKNKQMIVDVLFNTKVNKILFHDTQKTNDGKHIGIGVEVINNSTKHNVYLRDDMERNNEIILSAGTVDSPRILMRSGFGDRGYLKQCCDIDVIEHNAAIGRNLQDQIKFSVYFKHNPKFSVIAKYEIWKWKYKVFSGTMVNASGYDGNIFFNPIQDKEDNIPQIQFMLYNGIRPINVYNLNNEKCINTEIFDGVTVDIILLHPKSSGFVNMNVINPKYLSDEGNNDLELLLKGYREVERIFFGKEPFDGVVTFGQFWPCGDIENNNDATIKKYIVNNIQTNDNWIGTNEMDIVVDNKFILNNTLNVRVVDGSVIPSLISGSIQAPIVMMAHKASDIIMKKRLGKQHLIDNDSHADVNIDINDTPRHSEL